jgi:hypothetical protein
LDYFRSRERTKVLEVIALAVNVIIIWIIFESEETTVLEVIALAVNVIII